MTLPVCISLSSSSRYRRANFTHTQSTRAPPTAPPPQIKTPRAQGMLDIISEHCQQLIAVVPILFRSLSAARPLMFSTSYRSSPLIVDSFDDRSRFGRGLSRRRLYLKAKGPTVETYTGKQGQIIFAFCSDSSIFSLHGHLGFPAVIISSNGRCVESQRQRLRNEQLLT